jgi:hypothetical protein
MKVKKRDFGKTDAKARGNTPRARSCRTASNAVRFGVVCDD